MILAANQKLTLYLRGENDLTIYSKSSTMGIWLKDIIVIDSNGNTVNNPINFLINRLRNGNFIEEVVLEYGEVFDSPNRELVKNLKIRLLS